MKMSEYGRWMSTLSRLFFFSFSFSQILSGSMPAVRCWTMENCSLYRYQNVIILTLANEWIKLKFNRKFFALKLNSWQSWYLYAVTDDWCCTLHAASDLWIHGKPSIAFHFQPPAIAIAPTAIRRPLQHSFCEARCSTTLSMRLVTAMLCEVYSPLITNSISPTLCMARIWYQEFGYWIAILDPWICSNSNTSS